MKWDARYKTIVIKLLYMSRYNFCNCFVGCPFHDVSPGVPVAVKIIDKSQFIITTVQLYFFLYLFGDIPIIFLKNF